MVERRAVLRASAGLAAAFAFARSASGLAADASEEPPAPPGIRLGEATPFDPASLRERARALAGEAFRPRADEVPGPVADLGYDRHRAIRFRPDAALWSDADRPYRVQFFHLGSFYETPVHVFVVEEGQAREVLYDPALFTFGAEEFPDGPPADMPDDLGFAGFRLHAPLNRPDVFDELAVFLGASYFRAVGAGQRYGLSARGIAVNTGQSEGEEFPDFVAFWLERPRPGASEIVLHALLDGPSVAGAYRFAIRPGATTEMDVDAALFPREAIDLFGVAPLTSMYLFGPADRGDVDDFRPAVHDSEGLEIWTGGGERIWRPLANPRRLRQAVYGDTNPRGFGLMQRTRDFDAYEDLEARYDLRPGLWVEPRSDWGRGQVRLFELPTDAEVNDNIVAFWVPGSPPEPGGEYRLAYRLHWCKDTPFPPSLARVVDTRVGAGGVPGTDSAGQGRKFVVDFAGGPLSELPADEIVNAELGVVRGATTEPVVQANPVTGGRRVFFDLRPEDSRPPVEFRLRLHRGGSVLSETWSYQWTP
ncbi:MAG: glucan biosynthesis protein [Azospirillaceae bacterium]